MTSVLNRDVAAHGVVERRRRDAAGTRNRIAARSPAAIRARGLSRRQTRGTCRRIAAAVRPRAPPARSASSCSASRNSNTRAPLSATPRRRTGTARSRSDCRYGRSGPPMSGPSSQSSPSQRRSSRIDCFRFARRALGVGVLDAQDERAALAAREQPVEQRRARVADVEMAGRTGRETHAHGLIARPQASSTAHGMRGDRFAPANGIDAFVGLRL